MKREGLPRLNTFTTLTNFVLQVARVVLVLDARPLFYNAYQLLAVRATRIGKLYGFASTLHTHRAPACPCIAYNTAHRQDEIGL